MDAVRELRPRRARADSACAVNDPDDPDHAGTRTAIYGDGAARASTRPTCRAIWAEAGPRPVPGAHRRVSHPQDLSLREQAAGVAAGELDPARAARAPPSSGSTSATGR